MTWPPEMDERLCILWPTTSLAALSSILKVDRKTIKARARELSLKKPRRLDVFQPSMEEWVIAATQAARNGLVRPADVMGHRKSHGIARARWRAWKEVLDANPQCSIAGLARISGFDHTSILFGLRRLQGVPAQHIRDGVAKKSIGRRYGTIPTQNVVVHGTVNASESGLTEK